MFKIIFLSRAYNNKGCFFKLNQKFAVSWLHIWQTRMFKIQDFRIYNYRSWRKFFLLFQNFRFWLFIHRKLWVGKLNRITMNEVTRKRLKKGHYFFLQILLNPILISNAKIVKRFVWVSYYVFESLNFENLIGNQMLGLGMLFRICRKRSFFLKKEDKNVDDFKSFLIKVCFQRYFELINDSPYSECNECRFWMSKTSLPSQKKVLFGLNLGFSGSRCYVLIKQLDFLDILFLVKRSREKRFVPIFCRTAGLTYYNLSLEKK